MDWQSKVVELLRVEIDDLVALARLAGADPATFYEGADLSGIELTPSEVAALAGASRAAEVDIPPFERTDESDVSPQAPRRGVLGLNLGARTAQVGRPGIGLVVEEPTVIYRDGSGRHLFGQSAIDAHNANPNGSLVFPFSEDKIQDPEPAGLLVRHLIGAAKASGVMGGVDILHAIPATAGIVQSRALAESSKKAGARKVRFVDAPLAAAIGSGLVVDSPRAAMVLVVGDYLAEVQVLSLSGRVYTHSSRAGISVMERSIDNYIRRNYDLLVSSSVIRQLRLAVETPHHDANSDALFTIDGWTMLDRTKKVQTVGAREITDALELPITNIINLAKSAIECTPPELAGDIGDGGFLLTGSGATVQGLGKTLQEHTGVMVTIPPNPEQSVIEGCSRILESSNWLDFSFIQDVNAPMNTSMTS